MYPAFAQEKSITQLIEVNMSMPRQRTRPFGEPSRVLSWWVLCALPTSFPTFPVLPEAGAAQTADPPSASVETPPASPAPAFPWPKKPVWLTELSFGVKEAYDNNVYLSGVGGLRTRESWITTASPKAGIDLAPLIEDPKILRTLSFAYAPDLAIYHHETEESHDAHRMTAAIQGQAEDFSFQLENAFTYVDGSENGPIYSDGRSAYATAVVRERREQFQDRARIGFQYNLGKWFARPTASLLLYDLRTGLRPPVGADKAYDNYADRYDVNGGVDFGYKLQPKLAATLGYRYGHQEQEQFPLAVDPKQLSSPSDYQRVLAGLEGKPVKWLTVTAQAGPDFRSYPVDTPTHTTPVNDKSPVKYYGEASVGAQITAQDTLAFKYKQWQWVSSTGKIPYYDSAYDLSYRRRLGAKFAFELGGRLGGMDYTGGNAATSLRDDWMYTLTTGCGYAILPHATLNLAYTVDLGRNYQDGVANPQPREFNRQVISLGAVFKF